MLSREQIDSFSEKEMQLITLGRISVLNDFDAMCKADGFVGFEKEEWAAIKKFFAFNNSLTGIVDFDKELNDTYAAIKS